MEEQERSLQAGQYEVLVVARIAEDRRVRGRVSRQVLEQPTSLDPELDPILGVVELGEPAGPAP